MQSLGCPIFSEPQNHIRSILIPSYFYPDGWLAAEFRCELIVVRRRVWAADQELVSLGSRYVRNRSDRLVVTDVDEHGQARTQTVSSWRDAFALEWEAFHRAIATGVPPKTGPAGARDDLVLCADMIAAMRISASAA